MTKSKTSLAVVGAAVLFLAGCASNGDMYGYGNGNGSPYTSTIHGTIDYVDASTRSIVLYNTSGYDSMLSGGRSGGGSVRVYYDNRTSVRWQGRDYRPDELERGDQVDVAVRQSGNQLVADAMNVTYNANTATTSYPNNGYPSNGYPSSNLSTIRGTVRYIDTSARTIQLEQTTWITGFLPGNTNRSLVTVQYDSGQRIDVNGQLFPVTNLERGDVVEVQAQNYENANLLANRITLVRDVRR